MAERIEKHIINMFPSVLNFHKKGQNCCSVYTGDKALSGPIRRYVKQNLSLMATEFHQMISIFFLIISIQNDICKAKKLIKSDLLTLK
jgi:hypothetical protein